MVPPIIALVFALVVAFLTFQTSQVDTRMAAAPATASASIDDEAADDSEDMAEEAEPEEEEVDLGE